MSESPTIFENSQTGARIVMPRHVRPFNSGDLLIATLEDPRLRPLVDPHVRSFTETPIVWSVGCWDPATSDTRHIITRIHEGSVNLNSKKLSKVAVTRADTEYLNTRHFILFHGYVDKLETPIVVMSNLSHDNATVLFGNRVLRPLLSEYSDRTGSRTYRLPDLGDLYLPSACATWLEPDRVPMLDHWDITPLPVDQADLSCLVEPPLMWDQAK